MTRLLAVVTTSYCLLGTMADGSYTRAGSAANNRLPLGTQITVDPPFLNRRRWTVRDRIGWGTELDLWAPSCALSRSFGRRTTTMRVGWPKLYARRHHRPIRPPSERIIATTARAIDTHAHRLARRAWHSQSRSDSSSGL